MGELDGKTVFITGASGGIGRETARELGRLGAHVVISGRDERRTRETLVELASSIPGGRFDSILGDLSSMAEVQKVSREFETRFGALHVLINNAGAINLTRELTVDGYERTFATNHLAPFLMTKLLMGCLEKAGSARVITVASTAHQRVTMDFDDLMSERSYRPRQTYGRSKLANILFTRELAGRLAGKNITANSLHPGVVASNFFIKPGIVGLFGRIGGLFMISNEEGARTSVYLASSKEVQGVSGQYFVKCKVAEPTHAARDDLAARKLWDLSEKLTAI